jgi:hypothetical protein
MFCQCHRIALGKYCLCRVSSLWTLGKGYHILTVHADALKNKKIGNFVECL